MTTLHAATATFARERLAPRRRVVEHTFARPGRCRRPAKDVEATIKGAVAWITIASIRLMISRLART